MSAESAHLSTFGAKTKTEAEIWSTSNNLCSYPSYFVYVIQFPVWAAFMLLVVKVEIGA